jgi:hypothetical protein
MNHLKSLDGGVTTIWDPDRWTGHPILEKYKNLARTGYSQRKDWFQQFFKFSPDMLNHNIAIPELPKSRKVIIWWIVKLGPGQIQPMHIDPHLTGAINPVRYTMFLQDWQPGHIFVYHDEMISNYKAGDVYEWDDPMVEHGVANIGYETRYTVQIAMHDELVNGEFIGGKKVLT